MFDLFRSRQKAVRYLLGGILTVVAVSMVTYLIPGFGSNSGLPTGDSQILAEIGDQQLTAAEAQLKFQQIAGQGQIAPEMMETYFPQFVDSMILQRAAVYQAKRMGLTISDDELLYGLQSAYPQFFQNGALISKDQFEQYFAQQGETLEQGLDDLRSQLLLTKLQNAVLEGIFVSPQEVQQAFKAKYEKAKVAYIAFPPGKFTDQAKPTDEELKASFNANREAYKVPEKFGYQVVVIDQDKVEQSIQITDAQLRQAYAASMDNFRTPERIHARHILLRTEGKSDAEKKALQAKAEDLLKQLKGGAKFEELAAKNSEDPGSKDKGGDLGELVKDQTVPAFDRVMFSLKPGELSGVVTTEFGYHIIQVVDRKPAKVQSFDEVKGGLMADLRKQSLTDKMQSLGDQVRAALAKAPGSAAAVAKQFNVDLVTVPTGLPGGAIPTLGESPEVAGTLQSLKAGEVSNVLALPANRLAIVVLNERVPSRAAEYVDVADQVKQKWISDKAGMLATDKAKEAADRIAKGEDVDKVAKSMKLDMVTSSEFGRSDSIDGLGPAVYLGDAFTKPAGTVLGPTFVAGRNVVAKLLSRSEPDESAMAAEHDALLFEIKQKKAQDINSLFMDSILTTLVKDGKVKKHQDAIQRMMASYHR